MTNLVVADLTGTAGTVTGVRTNCRVAGDLLKPFVKDWPSVLMGESVRKNLYFLLREPRAVMADSSAVVVR